LQSKPQRHGAAWQDHRAGAEHEAGACDSRGGARALRDGDDLRGEAKSDTERAKDSSDLKLAAPASERAVAEYKAALLAAPWWPMLTEAGHRPVRPRSQYDDAVASLISTC